MQVYPHPLVLFSLIAFVFTPWFHNLWILLHDSVFLLSLQYDLTDTMIPWSCCLCTLILLPLQCDPMLVLSLQYDSTVFVPWFHHLPVSTHDSTILLYLHSWLHNSWTKIIQLYSLRLVSPSQSHKIRSTVLQQGLHRFIYIGPNQTCNVLIS